MNRIDLSLKLSRLAALVEGGLDQLQCAIDEGGVTADGPAYHAFELNLIIRQDIAELRQQLEQEGHQDLVRRVRA
ncbi:hypothetical protein CAF53_08800 [Sphingobium sp. LB126]|uniref:hypothetical protein n=1 Tax=Sphingobium sp. LB126 TaxID=1983755 RepID=UPI000C204F2A|nr:hypothetical protein [Sphingobium sp. LB126]PJG48327.1 hypothetical protein CAF53_08800 [Sphingobium sp. LB126]